MIKVFSIVNGKEFLDKIEKEREESIKVEKAIDKILNDLFEKYEDNTEEEPCTTSNKITDRDIHNILAKTLIKTKKYGDKTAVLMATLPNGFEIVTSSSCVDPKNFDMKIGEEICMKKLEDKIWELEGYRLQCELSKKGGNK